jgi:hypothetical protein
MKAEQAKTFNVRKEMGITHSEFFNTLPELLHDIPYQHIKDTIRFQLRGMAVEINLEPEQVRELGLSVRLPVTVVNLSFYGCSEDEANLFIKHFNLKFMKGGG